MNYRLRTKRGRIYFWAVSTECQHFTPSTAPRRPRMRGTDAGYARATSESDAALYDALSGLVLSPSSAALAQAG